MKGNSALLIKVTRRFPHTAATGVNRINSIFLQGITYKQHGRKLSLYKKRNIGNIDRLFYNNKIIGGKILIDFMAVINYT